MTAEPCRQMPHSVQCAAAGCMECGICWQVYDPAVGDDFWNIPPGTPFDSLPGHWRCPACDAPREKFLRLPP